MTMNIPVTKPVMGEEEVAAVAECLSSGWLVQGPKVAEFEGRWSDYVGAGYSRATTSCTTALHLAMLAIGVTAGDEVIVPAFTWVATANAVEYCGATPVFVDIDPATFNIDVMAIEKAITPRTVAVVPVHEFGLSADMEPLLEIARLHGLKVVEDAACACGARYNGRHVGTFGDVGCFSFHPRKAITTGEGGMVTTGDADIAHLIEVLRSHGAEASDLQRHTSGRGFALPEFAKLGYNYRMTDIQAAIGIVQMDRLEGILDARRAVAHRFSSELAHLSGITLPVEPDGSRHVYQSYVTMVDGSGDDRDRIALALQDEGIATRQGTHAVHALKYYRDKYGTSPQDFPNAWRADRQSLTLPVYAGMTRQEQDYVIEKVRSQFS
jgi:perosamine synthetase